MVPRRRLGRLRPDRAGVGLPEALPAGPVVSPPVPSASAATSTAPNPTRRGGINDTGGPTRNIPSNFRTPGIGPIIVVAVPLGGALFGLGFLCSGGGSAGRSSPPRSTGWSPGWPVASGTRAGPPRRSTSISGPSQMSCPASGPSCSSSPAPPSRPRMVGDTWGRIGSRRSARRSDAYGSRFSASPSSVAGEGAARAPRSWPARQPPPRRAAPRLRPRARAGRGAPCGSRRAGPRGRCGGRRPRSPSLSG